MSFLSRIWRTLSGRAYLVGRDLEGNRYYEYPSTSEDARRTKRVVKYVGLRMEQPAEAAMRARTLPVQWTTWLSHTRPNPPTIEELEADVARQRRVLARVAFIEERERERRARMALQAPAEPGQENPNMTFERAQPLQQINSAPGSHAEKTPEPKPEPTGRPVEPEPIPVYSDEPQAWIPQAPRRRGE
ncbi:hypothetical protein GLOTRDRAFT_122870 [Gloeophyllum trabeum ATCC 11539]|uniref:NADH dehydrogenase [ubiquinone] 1 alpha subcomplex subunit n=1 Tax=Gloeophyllum trabeum (strain ATCC 11539 / FP-39264 / Madison 617) TaxID=670483 RepID=S7RI00_GLOTA|nr:uncharacterized protein GLOTRDRAFT_122870 [Gloeophyllum trabeum ATCC 11539]EPQ52229.1 hypothetical protein GLOTRDRAFT_122870 [Gloeophyllum trabeum ATCC 11539]